MSVKVFKILFIIDDPKGDADVRQKLADAHAVTFEIVTVGTLADAFILLHKTPFDVLPVNLAVPDYGGIESLRGLILAAKEIPVVVVSSPYDEAQALEAVRAGAEDYTVGSRMNSAAFERVILYSIERYMAHQKTALQFSVSRVLAEAASLRDAADGILRALCQFAKFERGEVWQSDRAHDRLFLLSYWIPPSDSTLQTPYSPATVVRGEGLVGKAWEFCAQQGTGNDANQDAENPPSPGSVSPAPLAAVAIPLSVGAGALGVLALFGHGTQAGDEDFTKLLTSVGSQLGQFMARKTAEEERESLGTECLIILDSTPEGIYGLDCNGCVTFMNKSAARILGCTPEQVLGRKAHPLFHHSHPDGTPYPELKCPISRLISTGESHRTDQEYFWKLDGSHVAVDYSAKSVFTDDRISGAVVSFSDISDKREMEVELRHAQKLEAVGRLAAGIAHEINTPIQVIGDNTRFMQDSFRDTLEMIEKYEQISRESKAGSLRLDLLKELDDIRERIEWSYLRTEIPKAMEQALDGVNRVATIVRAMKEFSHVDRSSEKAAADLNKAIESTLIVARNEVKYVADVETNFAALPPVICHLGDLNQVFLNLLVNAAHAIAEATSGTETKGRIVVQTQCEGDFVIVSIGDIGMGIPETVREKVFDPFFTTKEVGKGTGQGLALARAIVVDKHGGTLTFETQMGKGTTFYVQQHSGSCAAMRSVERRTRRKVGRRPEVRRMASARGFTRAPIARSLECRRKTFPAFCASTTIQICSRVFPAASAVTTKLIPPPRAASRSKP
jgi:PAS domain S-box-containing protein